MLTFGGVPLEEGLVTDTVPEFGTITVTARILGGRFLTLLQAKGVMAVLCGCCVQEKYTVDLLVREKYVEQLRRFVNWSTKPQKKAWHLNLLLLTVVIYCCMC